jgi:Holliday junction resolvasome RuvABC DNA-binding subunit
MAQLPGLLDSNATQHKVTLLLDYKTAMMSQQKSEYLHEKQKIDQQFNMYAFTEEQDKLLFEYLLNIYDQR